MKRITINFFLFLLLVLSLQSRVLAKESAFSKYRYAASTLAAFQQQEPKKQSSATINQPAKKLNLWKSLLEFLKFKNKADKKLDGKVLLAIEKLGLTDSIAATSANVRAMIAELKKTKYPDIDSLQSVLSTLIQKQEEANKSAALPADAVTPSNADLAALANQLIPILDKRVAAEDNNIDKYEKIRALNRVKNADPKTVYSFKVSDSVTKRYTLQLKNKTEIYGFFDAAYPAKADAFFNAATSMIYYALPVNESTGNFDRLNGWDTNPVIDKAQKSGSKVYFTVLIAGKNTKSPVLFNPEIRQRSITNILALLKKRNANGVNISFKYLPKGDKKYFSEFLRLLHQSLQAENPSYKVFITLPRTNFDGAYDVEELNKYTDRYFIDFASNTAPKGAPLAPLAGKGSDNINTSYTWYLANGITADKLAIILPYRGVKSAVDPITLAPRLFSGYLPFSQIRSMTQSTSYYSAANETAYIDTVYHDLSSYRIWYDDESTLSKKYNYILKNNVAGIGLYYINYDDSYTVLNDELMYKFTYVDTTYIKQRRVGMKSRISLLEKVKRHLILWDFILQNPCATCFEDSLKSSKEEARIIRYLRDLRIYTLVKEEKKENAKRWGRNRNKHISEVTFKDVFNYINAEFNTFLKYISLVFLMLSIGGIVFYIWSLRYYGNNWRYQKLAAGILFVLISIFVLLGFTFCFTSDLIPIFGTSADANIQDCKPDPNCINIPFNTLLLVIVLSVALGFLIFNYLITPLIKRHDLP